MTKLILTRHGQSVWNAENKFTKRQIQIFVSGVWYGQTRHIKRIGEWSWHRENWDMDFKAMQDKFGIMSNELDF